MIRMIKERVELSGYPTLLLHGLMDRASEHMEMHGGELSQLETGRCVHVNSGMGTKEAEEDEAMKKKSQLWKAPLGWSLPWVARASTHQDPVRS